MLKKCFYDPSNVLSCDSLDMDPKIDYEEKLIKILDKKDKKLCNKVVPLVKVLWRNKAVKEITWETETDMRENIRNYSKFHGQNFYKWEGLLHPRFSVNYCNWRVEWGPLRMCTMNSFHDECLTLLMTVKCEFGLCC